MYTLTTALQKIEQSYSNYSAKPSEEVNRLESMSLLEFFESEGCKIHAEAKSMAKLGRKAWEKKKLLR